MTHPRESGAGPIASITETPRDETEPLKGLQETKEARLRDASRQVQVMK
jgi:hypothetical protein